ncbi:putative serine/arginine repetitive matrix protein 2 [Iris pallida]|uniref:Serine/arginine repetitive matrix protein 2 n=1 Tax=Iris pallida TaxID=29817 RepID=A0AAX6EFQ9_IRIPA|nr:putative serine/arginine repetitive matrix protein 2 [Iris pallida]
MEEKAAAAAAADEVMAAAAADDDDDLGEGTQCSDHPYRTNPGGICAFCLQEKLGKLLSTATPTSFFTTTATTTTTLANPSSSSASTAAAAAADILLLKRSKSVAPRPDIGDVADTPRRKKKKHFWSFLYHHSSSSATPAAATAAKMLSALQDADGGSQALSSSSAGRRVARSRSVGCGSRSFSGDFLERISTGLGDCTLRRAESQRETRRRAAADADAKTATRNVRGSRMKERARCGGIFRGFGASSAPSSSSYWLSAAGDDDSGKGASSSSLSSTWRRNRNWGWAFASPMRAFKPVTSAPKSAFGNANAVAGINRSTGVGIGDANPPSSLLAATE